MLDPLFEGLVVWFEEIQDFMRPSWNGGAGMNMKSSRRVRLFLRLVPYADSVCLVR